MVKLATTNGENLARPASCVFPALDRGLLNSENIYRLNLGIGEETCPCRYSILWFSTFIRAPLTFSAQSQKSFFIFEALSFCITKVSTKYSAFTDFSVK
ncbi:hypothetical protein OUZ56_001402 [Daphnia magna]|uniref:Uncharacterized protein n=1 Tax=Daphnia magna TaxID=35525 RepID=A0ABR0A328_9CRUS|nr:hypothetical protein OUZ56_001402 [Daphnia magna]